MMKYLLSNSVIILGLVAAACNNSSFDGAKKGASEEPTTIIEQPQTSITPANTPTTDPTIIQPIAPVITQPDGITLIDECGRCEQEAINISRTFQNPFTATKSNAYSLGNYENQNFCDIHFYRNLVFGQIPGAIPHAGSNGKVQNQNGVIDHVVVYCPCDCNWAQYPTFE